MVYLYEETENGIRISRVFGHDGIVEILEEVEGRPVTELGAYIFSDRMDQKDREQLLEQGILCTEEGKRIFSVDKLPEIAGERLTELVLPRTLEKIGPYAFYNCRKLTDISFGGALKDLGAGALTGCHQVRRLTVNMEENRESCLREILTELPEALCVELYVNGEKGCFWFPEFFEEGVENTPARILENHVHGSGIRYRNCFQHRVLDTGEYDRLFAYAIAWEQEETVLHLALGRVFLPLELTEKARENYLEFLRKHIKNAVILLGEQREYETLGNLLPMVRPDRETVEAMLESAQRSEDSRWTGILMEYMDGLGKKKRRSFDL